MCDFKQKKISVKQTSVAIKATSASYSQAVKKDEAPAEDKTAALKRFLKVRRAT